MPSGSRNVACISSSVTRRLSWRFPSRSVRSETKYSLLDLRCVKEEHSNDDMLRLDAMFEEESPRGSQNVFRAAYSSLPCMRLGASRLFTPSSFGDGCHFLSAGGRPVAGSRGAGEERWAHGVRARVRRARAAHVGKDRSAD